MGGFAAHPFPPSNRMVSGIIVFEIFLEKLNIDNQYGKIRFLAVMSPPWIVVFSEITITFSDQWKTDYTLQKNAYFWINFKIKT